MSLSSYAELRRAGHRMVDLLVDYWEGVAARRVAPEEELSRIFARFADTLGDEGVGLDSTVAELGMVLDASMAMSHPLYLGLVNSSPLPEAALADLVVSALDNNGGASHQGPAQAAAEREVIRWLADRLGYAGDGIILPGGSYAMVQALHLAKARQFPHWLQVGPHRLDGEPRVYTSAATHFSVTRAAHVIGLGDAGLVRVAFASRGAMCPAALEAALRQDRAAGRRPLAVVATVGSTGTGAIDPLTELADLCDEFGVWFHVDACYGGAAALLAGEHVLRAGLQRADSLCMDLHKWFFMPLTAGILLTRHADLVRQTFDVAASYIPVTDIVEAYCRGVPTSRRAAGLVAWFGLRTVGWNAMEEAIVRNIRLTRRLEQLLRQRGFRVMDDGALSIACARWEPVGWEAAACDDLQSAISAEICRGGEAWFATTCHAGETWLRFNAVNLHTRDEHMDQLADIVTHVARRLAPPLEQSA